MVADLLQVTIESAQTAVRGAEIQSTRIAATMIATGMPFPDARIITPATAPPTIEGQAPAASLPDANLPPVQPAVTPGGAARPNTLPEGGAPQIAPNPAATPGDPNAPSLTSIQLSTDVGGDDCPVNASTSFSTAALGIYVSAVANNLDVGNVVTARWRLEGQEVIFYDWSPAGPIDGACIWFYLPQSDVPFTPGSWNVELFLDGQSAGAATSFVIQGEAGAAAPAATDEMTGGG